MVTDNPLSPACRIGNTFYCQLAFKPASTTKASGVPSKYLYAIIIVLATIVVKDIATALMYRSKK